MGEHKSSEGMESETEIQIIIQGFNEEGGLVARVVERLDLAVYVQ